jgi:hypothetical protein
MARITKSPAVLVLVLLVLSAVAAYYVYNSYEGFRSLDCKGVTCAEGQFCQSNTCHPIYPPNSQVPA